MSVLSTPQAACSDFMKMLIEPGNNNALILIVLTALCMIVPLDLTQLIFACLGAFCYYLVQMLQKSVSAQKRPNKKPKAAPTTYPSLPVERKHSQKFHEERDAKEVRKVLQKRNAQKKVTTPMDTQAQSPVVPVVAPTFQAVGLEAEVQELLGQIMPTAESNHGVDRLAEAIRVMLVNVLPEVEVAGFCSSNLSRGRANGVAVPDVDIVINVSPANLASKLASRPGKPQSDPRMLQKWALRACADKLVSAGGFKFRRSGFRGNEPKMTLLVPPELAIFNQAVPIDISVNAVSPLHSAALLTECGTINPRAKELILLVRRWAKDRGVCHAPKGHFSPYIWSLLTIFFLQAAERSEGSLLPSLSEFEAISNLLGLEKRSTPKKWSAKEGAQNISTAALLREFMRFYSSEFPWEKEAVCLRRGGRGPAPLKLPIHIIEHDDGKTTEPGPSVEDPFELTQNLGSCMTWWSFQRMKDELKRGADILSKDAASLSELLEPWTPEMAPDAAGESP